MILINSSGYDLACLEIAVNAGLPPRRLLPKHFSIEVSDVWFDEDASGARRYDDSIEWDGTAFSDGRVWIVISQKMQLPMIWWVNKQLPGKYIRGMYIQSLWEYIVYAVAHETYHLVQWKRKIKKRFYKGGINDDEFEADLFAIMQLTKWRNEKK